MAESLRVAVSLDVEEEGLFRGRYACRDLPLANLSRLSRLDSFIARGVRPTLFCTHSVLTSGAGKEHLARLLPNVEIGAHLHHWNTPPLTKEAKNTRFLCAASAKAVPIELMQAKLQSVLAAGREFRGQALTSFRMGRWDLHGHLLPVLAANGITVDASVRPLHNLAPQGPDHFAAPADPYRIHTEHGDILEVPLTVTPLLKALARLPAPLKNGLRHWGALALLPVEHPLWLMRLTTRMHTRRGGRAISLTWHSSEMFPGGNPRLSSETAVSTFLAKISAYLDWLESAYNMEYVQMSQMLDVPTAALSGRGDWTWGAENHA